MSSNSNSVLSALDSVRESGIIIASDGAEYHKIGEFDPIDSTTNPSLVYAAVSKPEYAHLVEESVKYAQSRLPGGTVQERTDLAVDRLLVQVGAQILSIIPGRVSISVDPRMGYNTEDILAKSLTLIALVDDLSISRSRVLIKIPATPAGIRASHTLEKVYGIHTNLTLVFSLVQALACAQAGVAVISPFIGRVKDWWHVQALESGNPNGLNDQSLSEHPGIDLVHRIRAAFRAYGYNTQVMAAGFRKPEEIVELSKAGRVGGPDVVTLPPELLDELRKLPGQLDIASQFQVAVVTRTAPDYFSPDGPTKEGEEAFARDEAAERISLDKVPEGLAKFSVDAAKLEDKVRAFVVEREVVSGLSSNSSPAIGVCGHKRGVSASLAQAQRRTVQIN